MKKTDHVNLAALSDADLIAATRFWQAQYSRRTPNAARVVSMYEDEMTRRFGGVTTIPAALGGDKRRSRWKFWLH